MNNDLNWFKNALIYQVYPRSFADSNNDGVGDLIGITKKLDYLESLSINALWLCPIYESPMVDFGYDVSDFYNIDPTFGTLKDFDVLVKTAHEKNIKVIMDLVINHTSDQNPWFLASKSSKINPKRDWYIWKDPKPDGSPPNNWQSVFGGSAWTLDEQSGQYYLHTFLKEQPDLNWSNSAVRHVMQDIMRFWLKRGASGFRIDSACFIDKDPDFKDKVFYENGAINQMTPLPIDGFGSSFADYIKLLSAVCHEFPGSFMTFESDPYQKQNPMNYLAWYKLIDTSVSAPIYYSMIDATYNWNAQVFGNYVDILQNNLPSQAIPVYFYGNHDLPRLTSRIGDDSNKIAAMALIMLPGIRIIYYGDEIGMRDVILSKKEIQDAGKDAASGNASRDKARTPMQWSSDNYVGFSDHKPWLPVDPEYIERNVDTLSVDKNSLLSLYKHLNKLVNYTPALTNGHYKSVKNLHPDIFAFKRVKDNQEILIVLNFSTKITTFKTPFKFGTLLASTIIETPVNTINLQEITLQPHEGWTIEVQN